MSNDVAMDGDWSVLSVLQNGLQQGEYDELINGLEWSDIETSPGLNNGYSIFESTGPDTMETNTTEQPGTQQNPGNPTGVPQTWNIPSALTDPMFGGAPMSPQAYAVPTSHGESGQSEKIDSFFTDIEPMRLGSSDMKATILADPTALEESLGSIELNAFRNPSAQQSDRAQGPLANTKIQTQALPDSSQTQRPVVTKTTVSPPHISPDTTTAQPRGHYANYELPDFNHLKVSVKFMSTLITEKIVTNARGCLLHYQPPNQPDIPVPSEAERISIPMGIRDEQNGTLRDFQWVKEKQKRFTELILNSFDRGVEFYSKDGNVYAKRRSNTKLFWHSNDRPKGRALELKRNEETEVFNWAQFKHNLAASYALQKVTEVQLPAIWFSFAQKWDRDSSQITTKLVWARVDPIRACEMVKNVNPAVMSTSILESLRTSSLGFSIEDKS